MPKSASALHCFNDPRPESLIQQLSKITHALRVPELARLLAVSNVTLYRMAKSSRIPSFRIAGSVRFDPGSISRWLKEGK